MGAFNRIGLTWSGHHSNLWKKVMAGEWGFRGNITTDFGQKPSSLMEPLLAYEAGTTMFCTSGSSFAKYLEGYDIRSDLKLMTNMREALHTQLYNFANSAAMNGLVSDSKIVKVATWYDISITILIIVSAVVIIGSIAMLVLGFVADKKN
jgi:beta-glucosidase